jgi:thiol-disulfide isomerase/thioredoxin
MSENLARIDVTVREINYEKDKSVANEYGVLGTPATLIFKDGDLVKRHLGEITLEELELMIG